MQELQARVAVLQEAVDINETERAAAASRYWRTLKTAAATTVDVQLMYQKLEAELGDSKKRQKYLRSKVETLERNVNDLERNVNSLEHREQEGKRDFAKLQSDLGAAEKKRIMAERKCVDAAIKLNYRKDIVDRSKAVWEKEKLKLIAVATEVKAAARREQDATINTIGELQTELDRLQAKNTELEAEIDNLNEELQLKDTLIDVLKSEIKSLEKADVEAGRQILKLKETLKRAMEQKKLITRLLVAKTAEKVKRKESATRSAGTRRALGLPSSNGIPSRQPPNNKRALQNWRSRVVAHVGAVIKGRGLELVAKAIAQSHGGRQGLKDLSETKEFQPIIKSHVARTLETIQERLDARCGLYIFTFCDLSRSKYERLRNTLLNYDPVSDKYKGLVVWTNPFDETDTLTAPTLPSRWPLEKERDRVYKSCNVQEGSDGHVERDFEMCAVGTYSKYWAAMRKDFSAARPGQVLTFCDGTGAMRGGGLLHWECGVGDWLAGKACSRLSIEPGALGEFKESNDGIAASIADIVAPSTNKMIKSGTITIYPLDPSPEAPEPEPTALPIVVRHCGDFQWHKYASGQSGGTHPIWCCCVDFKLPDEGRCFEVWGDVEEWHEEIGCHTLTDAELHTMKHRSLELDNGLPFQSFCCKCGWQSGTKNQYLNYVANFDKLPPEEKKQRRKEHRAVEMQVTLDDGEQSTVFPHGNCELLMSHVLFNPEGMAAHAVDNCHMHNINLFKQVLSATVFIVCCDEQLDVIEAYLKAAGFPVKLKREQGEDPTDSWIGRDCMKMVDEAHLHLPHLLHIAHAPAECGVAALAAVSPASTQPRIRPASLTPP